MEIREMYIYEQNNSGGAFEGVRDTYTKDISILPVRKEDSIIERYVDLAVSDIEIIPREVYFDGVEEGIDCPCCGNRWSRLDEDYSSKEEVYIFDTEEEYKEYNLPDYTYYTILSDLTLKQ